MPRYRIHAHRTRVVESTELATFEIDAESESAAREIAERKLKDDAASEDGEIDWKHIEVEDERTVDAYIEGIDPGDA